MTARTAQEIWEAALGDIQVQISKSNYRTWFERTVGSGYQDNQFTVGVPNAFVAEYLDRSQRSLIEKTLIGLTSPDIKLVFQVNGRHHNPEDGADVIATYAQRSNISRFNSRYVFDSFIEGSCNRLARAAAVAVAQNPGRVYNPLFIYGGSGLGKTHLLHAIGHAAADSHVPVVCVSAEQFTNEFVSAIQERKTELFRNKYRNTGMLLIDDIHFIIGKPQTEESFFHTFNELHNASCQIVITSDRSPKEMAFLDDRLRSRFEWGLIVDIRPPDFETRLAILQAKAKQGEVEFSPDVMEFIAQQNQRNVRELEGSLNRVAAYAKLLRAVPTIELASQALEDIGKKTPQTESVASITPRLIAEMVAGSFSLTPEDLIGRRRDKETTLARRVAMYLIRQQTNCSLSQIGHELGDRDASAVTIACKMITEDLDSHPFLKRKISEIEQKLQPARKVSSN